MNAVAFDCGDCIPVPHGQTVQSVINAHADCGDCIQAQIDHLENQIEDLQRRAYAARQKKWEARVDAALAEAKESA